jgi:inner membrane protein
MWFIFGLIFMLIAVAIAGAAMITAWWLWLRATLPEGEPSPKWGDLRPLRKIFEGRSIVVRMIAVAVLAGAMTIPMGFIYDITQERSHRYRSVVSEISSSWGSKQTLIGPVLCVPYTVRYQQTEEIPLTAAEIAFEQSRGSERVTKEVVKNYEESHTALVLPEGLLINGSVSTETRRRSIYSARVYNAVAGISGSFAKHDLTELRSNVTDVHWDKAVLVVGITSTKAIRDIKELKIDEKTYKFLPGTGGISVLPTGFSAQCDLSGINGGEEFDFSFEVSVGGSDGFYMTPVGVSNKFAVASDWPHPNFTGSGLPSRREITPSGFSAEWEVPNLVRNYPQIDDVDTWSAAGGVRYSRGYSDSGEYGIEEYDAGGRKNDGTAGGHDIKEYVVGVEFFEPVFHYSLLERATKYGLLFIALTFLGVVIFENYYAGRGGAMLSMAQYAVIGAGLALFYLTLLAASEHVGFTTAYIIATAQGVIMTGGYVAAAMRQLRPAALIAVVQSMLYALLFFILRMEDHALLAGTALLVIATIALMAATRNINRPKGGAAS